MVRLAMSHDAVSCAAGSLLLVAPAMPGRSKVMVLTKRDVLAFHPGGHYREGTMSGDSLSSGSSTHAL